LAVNVRRVRSIKRVLAEHSSDDLRSMLEEQYRRMYAEDSRMAALELLKDRARGDGKEPSSDTHLRNQIRLLGWYYYVVAIVWLAAVVISTPFGEYDASTLLVAFPTAVFWWLGYGLRQFSPLGHTFATIFSFAILPAVPFGTIIALYSLDRLTRADHLFGK
jgi:hypothetical protein